MDEKFLIYTKMIVECTNLTVLNQVIGVLTNNILGLYSEEAKQIISELIEKYSDLIRNTIRNEENEKIPPNFIVMAMILITQKMIDELVEILSKNIEKFAEDNLDLRIKLGVKRGEIRYD